MSECKGCNGKGTWFSPMRGDIECDWCHGDGKLCSCLGGRAGQKCWACGLYRPPDFEGGGDTDPAFSVDWKELELELWDP